MDKKELEKEVAQRRTFAIISHPDAGKTTITEQLLLFGGVIREAAFLPQMLADWLVIKQV